MDVHSVASFFVSRVDTEVDKRLEAIGREDLRGIAAVANARAAYMKFKELFLGERFAALREAGAPVQRPLWASTGVKDPHYPETKYVDGLVAPHTVNTMPMATLLACAEQLEVTGATADQDPTPDLKALADAGIDMGDVTEKLLMRRHRRSSSSRSTSCSAGVESRARAWSPAARPRSSRRSRTSSSRRSSSAWSRRADEDVAQAHLEQGRVALGRSRRAGDRQPAGLARRSREKMLEHADELRRVRRRGAGRRASPTWRCSAWAARASGRR